MDVISVADCGNNLLLRQEEGGLINLNEQMEQAGLSSLDLIKVNCPLEVHSN